MSDTQTSDMVENITKAVDQTLEVIDQEREREIITRRFGLFERKETLEQIGELLGITRERVRQLEKAILIRLKINGEEGDEAHAAGGDHGFSLDVCPLCVLATDRQAPPSLPPALPVLAAAAQIVADLVVPPPPVLRVPWSAPPRGPPADAPLWF